MLKERLKAARKKAGLTQKQVASAIGVTESAYCGYETGKRQPDATKIKQIASVLGISGDYLLDIRAGDNEKKPTLSEEDGRMAEFVELFGQLTADHQKMIIAQIKGILSDQESYPAVPSGVSETAE